MKCSMNELMKNLVKFTKLLAMYIRTLAKRIPKSSLMGF